VKAEDWVRLGLAFALFGLLAIEVIAALWVVVVCCNQSTATPTPAVENLKSILTLVLSPSGLPSFLYCTERLNEDRLLYQHFGEPLDEGA